MKAYHQPLLEALQDEELRKEELKKRLLKMNSEQAELERVEKNQKEFDIITSNYMFQKQILEREVEEAAQKGNVAEYKKRTEDLDRLSKDFQRHHDLLASNEYGKMQKRLTSAAQEINLTFADLIRELLQGEKDEMSHGTFLKKLSKRLSLT